ncbi:MAG: hypothetical protein CMJ78_23265 [Planctomycetaceae bacterium]|nr:hypothetical protein [Planctomycetaceae bacterium]
MSQWESNVCNDKSGFLFSHKCDRTPSEVCTICDKPICEDHTEMSEGDPMCKSCVKVDLRKRGRREMSSRFGPSRVERDDPYYYGGYYYNGFGYYRRGHWGYDEYHEAIHDGNDFTEADAESLGFEGDADFENDMGES